MFFAAICYSMCFIYTCLFVYLFFKRKDVFLQPSMFFLLAFHVLIQLGSTYLSPTVIGYLPNPLSWFIIVYIVPILCILMSFICRNFFKIRNITRKIINFTPTKIQNSTFKGIISLFLASLFIAFIYCFSVPFKSTGFYSMLFSPETATLARERSLKLLNSTLVKYVFSFFSDSMSIFFVAILTLQIQNNMYKIRFSKNIILCVFYLFCCSVVLLPGARWPVAKLVLTSVFVIIIKKRLKFNFLLFFIALLCILSIPVLLSILREGKNFSFLLMFKYYPYIFRRILVTPSQTGLWFVHYAQKFSFWGVAGIPKIASLLGEKGVNVANVIYLHYTNAPIASGLANTCYFFSYYSYFGLWGMIVFAIISIVILDLLFSSTTFLSKNTLVACTASLLVNSLSFIDADFTTALISHGFIPTILISYIFDYICKIKVKKATNISKQTINTE